MNSRIRKILNNPGRFKWAILTRFSRWVDVPINVHVKLKTGSKMIVRLPDTLSTVVVYEGEFEPEVTEYIRMSLKAGSVFLDVGAHYGLRTLEAWDVMKGDLKIVAFEPGREQIEILRKNVLDKAEIVEKAVSDKSGKQVKLQSFSTRYVGSSTLEAPRLTKHDLRRASRDVKQYKVTTISIDDYVEESGNVPNLIKIDVENHEVAVLNGAKKTIKKYHPSLILEVGGVNNEDMIRTETIVNFLKKYDYKIYILRNGKLLSYKPSFREGNILAK